MHMQVTSSTGPADGLGGGYGILIYEERRRYGFTNALATLICWVAVFSSLQSYVQQLRIPNASKI